MSQLVGERILQRLLLDAVAAQSAVVVVAADNGLYLLACRLHQPVLVDARVGVGSQEDVHDVQAEKGKCVHYRRPVRARETGARQGTTA